MTGSFSYSHRLHDKRDFNNVLKKNKLTDAFVSVQFDLNLTGCDRLGMIISKRVVSKAVSRNYIKRLVREVFRNRTIKCKYSLDIVVTLRKNFLHEEKHKFLNSINILIEKAYKLLNEKTNHINNK